MGSDNPLDSPTELPWPRKGDKLFASAEDWYHNACLNWQFDNWELYASGYKTAGDVLVQHIIETRSDRDTLVFPIVFNYRQYLELRCKEIIRVGRMLSDEAAEFPKTHDIRILWAICRDIIAELEPSASIADLEAIDEAIEQFCSVDPKSEGFRYPEDRQGKSSIPAGLHIINLRQLRDVIARVASFFDGVSMAFSVYLDHKADMQSASW